jgi:hypothetical protein
LGISCTKDKPSDISKVNPEARIASSKTYFDTHHKRIALTRDSSLEAFDSTAGLNLVLDWNKLKDYYVPTYDYHVVEVPISDGRVSKFASKAESGLLDSIPSEALAGLSQSAHYLFVFNNNGNVLLNTSIVKYCPSSTSTQSSESLFYNTVATGFNGHFLFNSDRDSIVQAYSVGGGIWTSTSFQPKQLQGSVDRYGCTIGWLDWPCTGNNHYWEDRNRCSCGKECCPDCKPPKRIPIYGDCPSPVVMGGGNPPEPPTIPLSNPVVGSGGNGGSNAGCQCKTIESEVWATNFQTTFTSTGNYWFNIFQVAFPQCYTGKITSGRNSLKLVPGQAPEGSQVIFDSDQIYFYVAKAEKINPCKWRATIKARVDVNFSAVWSLAGGPVGANSEGTCHGTIDNEAVHIFD